MILFVGHICHFLTGHICHFRTGHIVPIRIAKTQTNIYRDTKNCGFGQLFVYIGIRRAKNGKNKRKGASKPIHLSRSPMDERGRKMRTSCIDHPTDHPMHPAVVIRMWQVEFCHGNVCAAALLSFFEYWHNIKLQQKDELVQSHTEEQLAIGIMGYSRPTIAKAITLLRELGAITVSGNLNPKYRFDKTRHFIFQPAVCNAWLKEFYA